MRYRVEWLAVMVCFAWSTAQAEVFQWRDAQGELHFGDQSTAEGGAKRKALPKIPEQDPEYLKRLENQKRFIDARGKERSDQQESAAKLAKEREAKDKVCKQAQERLEMLERYRRVYSENADGSRTYLSDEDRKKESDGARQEVKSSCAK